MSRITLIAAIGCHGQLGLNGEMPWGRAYPEDLKRFREITTGGVVVVGVKTWPSIRHLIGTYDRSFQLDYQNALVPDILATFLEFFPGRRIFIAGGAKTYRRWLPHVTAFDVTSLPYDGDADVWADFLIPHVTREIPACSPSTKSPCASDPAASA